MWPGRLALGGAHPIDAPRFLRNAPGPIVRARGLVALLAFLLVMLAGWWLLRPQRSAAPAPVVRAPELQAIGPRTLSNQTAQALAVYGKNFAPGLTLQLGAPWDLEVPLFVLDEGHAYARLPESLPLPPDQAEVVVRASLGGSAQAPVPLTWVNDAAFVDLTEMVATRAGPLFLVSTTTDTLFVLDPRSGGVGRLPTADGPSALAVHRDARGAEWVAVAHQFSPQLRLYSAERPTAPPRELYAPSHVAGLLVDPARGVVYLAEHKQDSVVALSLDDGRELWRTPVQPNPKPMALWGETLLVGSLQTGEVEALATRDGAPVARAAPEPGIPILGGTTERFAEYVMGGKAPRALVASPKLKKVFLSSIGPNIGPNPEKMEVSHNGGVAVLSPSPLRFERHLGFGAGVSEALWLDDARGLLFATDMALGVLRVLDAKALAQSDARARRAVVQTVPLAPPADFPTARPKADYGVQGRAGVELHSGPKALALSPDGRALYVLNRFTGVVAELDVARAKEGKAFWRRDLRVTSTLEQRVRRMGQVLYFADLGRTGMSCDSCHLEGHTEGVFFEKTTPLRIYRSNTVRGSRETPPYFTPASTRSLAETAAVVGGRNRFHNVDPSPAEVEALAAFSATVTLLPNPFVGPDGAPVERLQLPDGAVGRPRDGLKLFEGKAGCTACHPAPHFTTDQDPATRGRYLDVGTPRGLPLRVEMQDLQFHGFAPPSLNGAWDVFPMLTSGAAGLEVAEERLKVGQRFPLRDVLERYGAQHGGAAALTPQERNDLIAYVMSL